MRNRAEQRAAFLERISPRTDWTELFRSLSFIIPASAVFEYIRVDGAPLPRLTIRGYLSAASAVDGNADFNRFFSALGGLPFFKSVSMPKPTTVAAVEPPSGPAATQVAATRAKVSFEIICELP